MGKNLRKHRSLVLSVLLLIGSLAATVLAESVLSHHLTIREALDTAEDLGRLLEQQTAGVIEKPDLVLRHIVERMEGPNRPKDLNSYLKEQIATVPAAARIQLIDAAGNYYAASYSPMPAANIGDREYFLAQKRKPDLGLVISKPLLSRSTPEWVLVLSRRINDRRGRFTGVVIASISLDSLQRFYSTLNIGPHGSISLWNSDRVNLTRHPYDASKIGVQVAPPPELAELLTKKQKSGTYRAESRIDHERRVFHFRAIADLPLAVIVGLGESDILLTWKIKTAAYLLITLISSAIAFLLLRRHIRTSDLVERQQVEVARSSKMSSLGIMAAGIAHEVNNPLTVIRGNALNIQDLLEAPGDPESDRKTMRDSVRKIVTTVDRISRIIKGLRSFSRDSERDPKAWTPLQTVIENTLELCKQRFKSNGIELRIGKLPGCSLYCREAQISEILVNLLTNAFDAVQDKAQEPAGRWVEVQASFQQGRCLISVTDSGPGIPPEVAEKIMLPFFTTKATGKGTGLGLSISKSIAEEHGGSLFLDRKSRLTRFTVAIPARSESLAA